MTQQELHNLLSYDPSNGVFRWRYTRRGISGGRIAGCDCEDGYTRIRVRGILYLASRLAWFYMKGKWPKDQLDHINTIKGDNSWHNLREASPSQNGANRSLQINNQSGFKGVHYCNTRLCWIARIHINDVVHYLGAYNTAAEAGEAYNKAALEHYHEFARVA